MVIVVTAEFDDSQSLVLQQRCGLPAVRLTSGGESGHQLVVPERVLSNPGKPELWKLSRCR